MKCIKIFSILFFITFSVQCQKKEVKIETAKLTNQVYMLKGQGGNIGLFIGDDGIFMIDDQFAPLSAKILVAVKNITDKPLTYLINSHWHGDHTGGNENMQKEGALIVAHKNVRKRMNVDQIVGGKAKKAAVNEALPVITFSDDLMMHINNDAIFISHIHNAHTDGDALIYFTTNNVLHTGDSYFQGKFPYIDLDSGGSINGYIEGIKKMILLTDDKTKVIPGHGNISNKADLKVYLIMLEQVRENVLKEIDKGQTLKQVTDNKELTEKYNSFSGWITGERIRSTVYKSLQLEKK
ncbi:MAG: MBL fold metallo-hydrolase [Polaribacter sp.]|uniref:MBL fold metallo-hydrolase n=1 Tax=Polaribacter sp. TaxID=1920175 RepID=UPI002F34FEBC